jgi:hypothetical protein
MGWNTERAQASPIFEPLRVHGGAVFDTAWPGLDGFQRLLDARDPPVRVASGRPLAIVRQSPKPLVFEDKYEARIYLRGELQVRRDHWHDYFNLLVWLAFPRSKAALNARHFAALKAQAAAGAPNRGPAQDALTLFDEGGVVVASSDEALLDLLREWRWKELFWEGRSRLAARMQFMLFGHAVYEKALQPFLGRVEALSRGPVIRGCDGGGAHEPTGSLDALQPTPGSHLPPQRQALLRRPSATSRGILLKVEAELLAAPLRERLAEIDARLAAHLSDPERLNATRELAVVPILGVPGWHPGNASEGFYDDKDYFRPGRRNPHPDPPP